MKMYKRIAAGSLLLVFGLSSAAEERYEPNWESLDSRPVPQWFSDARFGIFIHWGVYSVPAWGPKGQYAEWYWAQMRNDKPDGPWRTFHNNTYGKDYPYEQFAPRFTAELFNPQEWAELFRKAGARYVVLTSKHHDGYCLWPAPVSKDWNSVDVGPGRDLLGELSSAVRDEGIRMGYYYSLHNWYDKDYAPADPKGTRNIEAYVRRVMMPQMKDLVEKYKPALIFADGEWTAPAEDFRSQEFLAWLFNDSAAPEDVVINDRWGAKTRSRHGGYYTTEYGKVDIKGTSLAAEKPWEECRGIGGSFGFNRNESVEDYLTRRQVVHLLIDIVSRGGNLLLNVGPTADGRIPPIMEDRLLAIGRWLEVNGEAVYGTKKWQVSGEGPTARDKSIAKAVSAKEAVGYTGRDIRYTQSADERTVYAIALGLPPCELVLNSVKVGNEKEGRIELLGCNERIPYTVNDQGQLSLSVPGSVLNARPGEYAYTFKLAGFDFVPAAVP
jgi:alpha-L-fucosidase